MPKFRRIAIPVITAAVITVATATSSYAYTVQDQASAKGGCALIGFSRDGDIFRILDTCSDGRGVRLQYTNPSTSPSTDDTKVNVNYTGGYNGLSYDNAYIYNTDFNESHCFYFRAGLVDNGSYVDNTYGTWNLACAS